MTPLTLPADAGREGAALAVIGSGAYLRTAVRGRSAARLRRADAGEKVHVKMRS